MSGDLGACPVCALVGYRTRRGNMPRHAPAEVRDPRTPCSGSGRPVPAIQRLREPEVRS